MRLNLVATLLFSLGGLVIAGLQANQHFLLPAIAPSMYDLGTLFGVLILAPEQGYQIGPVTLPAFGLGVYGLVYGVILGAALFLLVQMPGSVPLPVPLDAAHQPAPPGGAASPVSARSRALVTVFFIQLTFIAQDNIASRLADRLGLGPGLRLACSCRCPRRSSALPWARCFLPTLSEQIVRGEVDAFRLSLNRVLRVILALTIPIAAIDRCRHYTGGAHPGLRRSGHCHGRLDGAGLSAGLDGAFVAGDLGTRISTPNKTRARP